MMCVTQLSILTVSSFDPLTPIPFPRQWLVWCRPSDARDDPAEMKARLEEAALLAQVRGLIGPRVGWSVDLLVCWLFGESRLAGWFVDLVLIECLSVALSWLAGWLVDPSIYWVLINR